MKPDHVFPPVAKTSLIVFCPICEFLLTTIHLLHFRCQFPKLKKYHVEIFVSSTPSLVFSTSLQHHHGNFQSARTVEAARPCVWRAAQRGAGGAHMEQWPSRGKKKKKKHAARLHVPAVPVLIPPLARRALRWRRSAAIMASDCCWACARRPLTKTTSPRGVEPPLPRRLVQLFHDSRAEMPLTSRDHLHFSLSSFL